METDLQVMPDIVLRVASNLPAEWGWSKGSANGTQPTSSTGRTFDFLHDRLHYEAYTFSTLVLQ